MRKIKFQIKHVAVALIALATMSSCSDWLDVQPSNQTSAGKLFTTEKGFQEALTGVYTLMTKPESYGKEMTYGFVDVIAQQWSSEKYTTTGSYKTSQEYDFEAELSRILIEKIWLAQYKTIANVNDILAFVDDRKGVFEEDGYSIVKGEALALRAFLHFDVLRLIAPNDFALGTSTKYIPYVTEFSKNLTASFTAKEIADKCMEDLTTAIQLLEVDPIFTEKAASDLYYKNRILHMNYYAAKALQARIYFYMGEKQNALTVAKEVIAAQNAKRFAWVSKDTALPSEDKSKDFTYTTEHIFGLNIMKLADHIKGSFLAPFTDELISRKNNAKVQTLFADATDDYRAKLFSLTYEFRKFAQIEDSDFKDRMPMIRISEMYYIAAECSTDETDALYYLNEVRSHRGISTLITNYAELNAELFKEYQKEFVGEGQLFYYYKRLNTKIESSNDKFTFTLPLPRVEIDLGGRPRPDSK